MRKNVAKIKKKRTDAENDYKQLCTKYKIKPIRSSEDGEEEESDALEEVRVILHVLVTARRVHDAHLVRVAD